MSYAERRLRKIRRSKTGRELSHLYVRDTRFCDRWGISEADAYLWDRYPDHTIKEWDHDRG